MPFLQNYGTAVKKYGKISNFILYMRDFRREKMEK